MTRGKCRKEEGNDIESLRCGAFDGIETAAFCIAVHPTELVVTEH